jgi:hypothetical protein
VNFAALESRLNLEGMQVLHLPKIQPGSLDDARETAVIANMPGPREAVSLAGAPLSALMYWVPALGGTGLCLSIASYAGQIWVGVGTDQGLVPDPETLVKGFYTEFEELQRPKQEATPEQDAAVAIEGVFEAMNTLLDEAIASADELLESRQAR